MAFTEAQLIAEADPTGTRRTVEFVRYTSVGSNTEVYAVGVTAPYAGKARWVPLSQTRTPAQAWSDVQAALA
jgi:hypothetical protein